MKAININRMTALFRTSESDDKTIYRDSEGNYFCKRYGLTPYEETFEQVLSIAWLECNRRGMFSHLRYFKEGDFMPYLSNKPAQDFIVARFLGLPYNPKLDTKIDALIENKLKEIPCKN